MSTSKTISILIRTKNEAKDLPKALELIANQSLKPLDIVVVDSGSTDGTVDIVKQHSHIKLIEILPTEFSFGRALNIGIKATQADIVVSLSAHAFPCHQQWLQNLVKHFDNPKVAGVYGKQVPHDDAWPPVQREYIDFYGDRLRVQTRLDKLQDHTFSNANSAIRRQCWEQYSFNEILTGGEDRDWARAMLGLEYQIIYEPEAPVYHSHNESLLKFHKRTYREALAKKNIYGQKMTVRSAFQSWYRALTADMRFILARNQDRSWLLRAPIYRLFGVSGHLRPNLPNALWEPFVNRWKSLTNLNPQKE